MRRQWDRRRRMITRPHQCLRLDGAGYASHVDDDALDMDGGDFAIGLWFKTSSSATIILGGKWTGSSGDPGQYIFMVAGQLNFKIADAVPNPFNMHTSNTYNDGQWHFAWVVLDRSSDAGCHIYVDKLDDTVITLPDIQNVGNIDNANNFTIGTRHQITALFTGQFALGEQFYFGFSGLDPAEAAEYAARRFADPYGALADVYPTWAGYADADRGEALNETDFATHAKWAVTNDFDDTGGNAHYTWTGNKTSTLTQAAANRAKAGTNSHYYELTYTVAVTTAPDGDFALTLTTGFASSSTVLPFTAGTHRVVFQSAAAAVTGSFVIQAISGDDTEGEFTLDNISLMETGVAASYPLDGNYTDEDTMGVAGSNGLDLTAGGSGNNWELCNIPFV